MLTNFQVSNNYLFGTGMGEYLEARRAAGKQFDLAYGQAHFNQALAKLVGKSNQLRSLSHRIVSSSQTRGTVVVPLDKIVGSEGRCEDFDADFRPLKIHLRERWISIAVARRSGVVLPAVELVQKGDEYYVRDGHHRISVARRMGQLEIDARVVN